LLSEKPSDIIASRIRSLVTTVKALPPRHLKREFERQMNNLLLKDYPRAAGMNAEEFLSLISLLGEKVGDLVAPEVDLGKGVLPYANN
jgi:hypothetical protein